MKTLRKLMGLILVITGGVLVATAKVPPWWITRGVINTNLPPNNYSPVNLGQLKHVAKQAYWEMEAKLPNGAGDTLGDLVFGFAQKTNANYLPINLGQLKYVAKPFYDRLIQEGYTQSYPWTQTKADDNNYAAANLGQLKYLFSFDLSNFNPQPGDGDGDGLNDAWELEHFGNLDPLPDGDPDGDGIPNSEEEQDETDPNDPNPPDPEDIPSYAMVDFGLEGQGLKINEAGDLVGRKGANYFTIHKGQVKNWPGMMINDLNEKGDILLSPMDNGEGNTTIYHLESGEMIPLEKWDAPEPSDEFLQTPNLISYSYQGLKSKRAYSLNDSRQVLGHAFAMWKYTYWYLDEDDQYQEATSEGGDYVPMLWSPSEGQKINFNPNYGYWADAMDGFSINEQGAFVTEWYDDQETEYCHYWANAGASAQVLDLNFVSCINSQDQIAGQKDFMARFISADGSTDLVLGPGYATSVNDDGDVLVNNYDDKAFLVRKNPETQKYEKFALAQTLSDDNNWQMTMANDITKNGLIAGQVLKEGQKKAVAIFPAELGVDANRDGRITLLNEKDLPENASYEVDRTTEGKCFRFWKNDDQDSEEGDKVPPNILDKDNIDIGGKRDLEDLTRLWVYLKGVHEMVKGNDAMLVGLKWKDTTGNPAIRLFEAYEQDGGDEYLKNESVASQQVSTYGTTVQAKNNKLIVDSNGTFIFKPEIWESLNEENYKKYFLFEGVEEGKGKLQLVFLDKNQNEIGEAPPLFLEIKNIKDMYQRSQEDNQFTPSWDEKDEAVIFVHGWNMSPEGSASFAETMFKRLWHRGYKGRFAYFRWNTEWSDAFDDVPGIGEPLEGYLAKFNDSEYKAWEAGQALKTFVDNIPKSKKNIAAHSMGNIVAGSALLKGMAINNYALLQAAVPAACYDDRPEIKQTKTYYHKAFPFSFNIWDSASPDEDSDGATRALAYRGKLKNVNVAGNMTSFFLPQDHATSFAWEVNNDQTKPPREEAYLVTSFQYAPDNNPAKKLYKYHYIVENKIQKEVIDYYLTYPPEAMAYACRSWGKAAGAESKTEGSIDGKLDLSSAPHGFGTEHSAEFNRPIQKLKDFYNQLATKLEVKHNE